VPHRVVPASLEDVDEAVEVALHVGVGVDQGVAHAGLRGEVRDVIELLVPEERVDRGLIRDVGPGERELVVLIAQQEGVVGDPRPGDAEVEEAAVLDGRIVVVVDVVEADDLVALLDEPLRQVVAHEPRRTSHEHPHRPCSPPPDPRGP